LDFEPSTAAQAPASHVTTQSPVPQVIGPAHELALQRRSHELAVEQSIPARAVHDDGPHLTAQGPVPHLI
jgi:hypothetical protein